MELLSRFQDDARDESPFAYKDVADVINNIGEMVTIDKIIKPVYNFKAH